MGMKENILETARILFIRNGVRNVNVDEICRTIGISKRTFYQYYESKEDLISVMIDDYHESILKDFSRETQNCSLVETFARSVDYIPKSSFMLDKKIAEDVRKYYYTLFVSHVKKIIKTLKNAMVSFMEKGKEEGVVRDNLDVLPTALHFIFMHEGMLAYIPGEGITEGRSVSA